MYARQGVPEYWVADVQGRVVHQMWQPGEQGFGERLEVLFGEIIGSQTIVGLIVETYRI